MISYIYDAKTNIMKIVLSLSVLILLLSCGKYERPFITFKSPEKRLMGTTWRCVKAIDAEGLEFEVFDHISFAIDGSRFYVLIRETDFYSLKPPYLNDSKCG